MSSSSQIVFVPKMIFAVIAGLIVLAIIMGRKQRYSYRTGFGWWIGLGVLLVVVSGFLYFSRLAVSPIVEERRGGRSAFNQVIADMKEHIAAGLEAARESMKEGMDEVHRSVDEAQESINSVVKESKSTSKLRGANTTVVKGTTSTTPTTVVQWTVEVKDRERSQQQEVVEKRLHEKAASSVNRWLNDQLPVKYYGMQVIGPQWLIDNGAFPDPISYAPAEVPRMNSSLTDKLYGGALTVKLLPNLQQTLLDLGYQELEQSIQAEKLQTQGVIFIVLMGITGFMGILGLVKMVVSRRTNVA